MKKKFEIVAVRKARQRFYCPKCNANRLARIEYLSKEIMRITCSKNHVDERKIF